MTTTAARWNLILGRTLGGPEQETLEVTEPKDYTYTFLITIVNIPRHLEGFVTL